MIGLLIAFGIERFDGARERFAHVIEFEAGVFEDEFARPYHAGEDSTRFYRLISCGEV